MKRYHALLSDIIEILECFHEVTDSSIAGNGTGRFTKPTIDGVKVSLHHDDLECSTVRVVIWDSNLILTEASIMDPFDGEVIVEFIAAVVDRINDRAGVQ